MSVLVPNQRTIFPVLSRNGFTRVRNQRGTLFSDLGISDARCTSTAGQERHDSNVCQSTTVFGSTRKISPLSAHSFTSQSCPVSWRW